MENVVATLYWSKFTQGTTILIPKGMEYDGDDSINGLIISNIEINKNDNILFFKPNINQIGQTIISLPINILNINSVLQVVELKLTELNEQSIALNWQNIITTTASWQENQIVLFSYNNNGEIEGSSFLLNNDNLILTAGINGTKQYIIKANNLLSENLNLIAPSTGNYPNYSIGLKDSTTGELEWLPIGGGNISVNTPWQLQFKSNLVQFNNTEEINYTYPIKTTKNNIKYDSIYDVTNFNANKIYSDFVIIDTLLTSNTATINNVLSKYLVFEDSKINKITIEINNLENSYNLILPTSKGKLNDSLIIDNINGQLKFAELTGYDNIGTSLKNSIAIFSIDDKLLNSSLLQIINNTLILPNTNEISNAKKLSIQASYNQNTNITLYYPRNIGSNKAQFLCASPANTNPNNVGTYWGKNVINKLNQYPTKTNSIIQWAVTDGSILSNTNIKIINGDLVLQGGTKLDQSLILGASNEQETDLTYILPANIANVNQVLAISKVEDNITYLKFRTLLYSPDKVIEGSLAKWENLDGSLLGSSQILYNNINLDNGSLYNLENINITTFHLFANNNKFCTLIGSDEQFTNQIYEWSGNIGTDTIQYPIATLRNILIDPDTGDTVNQLIWTYNVETILPVFVDSMVIFEESNGIKISGYENLYIEDSAIKTLYSFKCTYMSFIDRREQPVKLTIFCNPTMINSYSIIFPHDINDSVLTQQQILSVFSFGDEIAALKSIPIVDYDLPNFISTPTEHETIVNYQNGILSDCTLFIKNRYKLSIPSGAINPYEQPVCIQANQTMTTKYNIDIPTRVPHKYLKTIPNPDPEDLEPLIINSGYYPAYYKIVAINDLIDETTGFWYQARDDLYYIPGVYQWTKPDPKFRFQYMQIFLIGGGGAGKSSPRDMSWRLWQDTLYAQERLVNMGGDGGYFNSSIQCRALNWINNSSILTPQSGCINLSTLPFNSATIVVGAGGVAATAVWEDWYGPAEKGQASKFIPPSPYLPIIANGGDGGIGYMSDLPQNWYTGTPIIIKPFLQYQGPMRLKSILLSENEFQIGGKGGSTNTGTSYYAQSGFPYQGNRANDGAQSINFTNYELNEEEIAVFSTGGQRGEINIDTMSIIKEAQDGNGWDITQYPNMCSGGGGAGGASFKKIWTQGGTGGLFGGGGGGGPVWWDKISNNPIGGDGGGGCVLIKYW